MFLRSRLRSVAVTFFLQSCILVLDRCTVRSPRCMLNLLECRLPCLGLMLFMIALGLMDEY